MSEFDYINWIKRHPQSSPVCLIGPGDDCAVLNVPAHQKMLFASDMLLEGVHFLRDEHSPQQIGRKALAVNLSDIAAMGGQPHSLVISLALTKGIGKDFAQGIYEGIAELAAEYDVVIAGGDTNSWNGPFAINIAITGFCPRPAITRSGAKAGDVIYVTGPLGGSIFGRHLSFTPRIKESLALLRSIKVHSMIDISDGLARDLGHILLASGVGANLDQDAIPIHTDVKHHRDNKSALEHALTDGEDFELCLTLASDDAIQLEKNKTDICPGLKKIGVISSRPGLTWKHNGEAIVFNSSGFEHQF